MMDRTDRHCRYLLRLLGPEMLLYTEMVVGQAVLHGDQQRHLGYDPVEHPLALQLGGSDPQILAEAAVAGAERGYDEINLNIGCPSDRVQSGEFGACLMDQPARVADCVSAIRERVAVPVTIKSRIGIDDKDDYAFLGDFVASLSEAGVDTFIVHARKAILAGLSPAENRTIPPLRYERVYQLKQDFPHLHISINGGIRTTADALSHLQHVDGVMIGRQAYADPFWLSELHAAIFGTESLQSRDGIVRQMADYAAKAMSEGARLNHVTRHMLGLYAGQRGARAWRRFLSQEVHKPDAGPELLVDSLRFVT
ncbi:MAG: tRNA dihydrouridine(20/20a) synthase DusA [Gammaproteobacteria bacterium]|nr:tRNA dihydrouridine(20/20a) synthase DusA [Gammaproteobacteria bacterium]NND54473.1 tRNA dihydrouridine(20/20a) synthase DusA [Gammaproteobacteria bacterium]